MIVVREILTREAVSIFAFSFVSTFVWQCVFLSLWGDRIPWQRSPAPPQVDSHKARFPPYLISSIEFSPTESNQLVRRIKTLGPHSILHQLSMSLWGDFQWGIHVNFQLKIHVNFQTAEMNTSLSTANWIFNWKGNAATGN